MVVCESSINNIMGGIENTGGVTLHNHRRKLKQRFDIIKKLGQGTYGKVQLGINKETGQEVAIKTIKKCKIETEADLIRIRREIQIMSSVQHPNIIHIYEVFENREKMVLVMEYAAGGELYDYLSERKVLSEDEARRIFRQIATAVYYCHKHKICHRDLKLENILLDENGSAKIADFGLSNVFDDRRLLSTFCGSPLYASPEIVKGTPYVGPEVDCWSLGVLLYTLVYGAMPFDGSNFKRLVKQISQGDYFEPKKPSSASPLIREMLTVLPEQRANIENICTHWWVNTSYKETCLDIAEELANQTPVRLDLLLSLAPPPPQVGSDKLVIAGESSSMVVPPPPVAEAAGQAAPARSQSVGSLMELVPSAERRIRDLVSDENNKQQQSPKRKLEVTVSTDHANLSNSGAKRKEILQKNATQEFKSKITDDKSQIPQQNDVPLTKNLTQTLVKDELPPTTETTTSSGFGSEEMIDSDPNLQGAACSELIEESKKNNEQQKEKKKTVKIVKKKVDKPTAATNEVKDSKKEIEAKLVDKENASNNVIEGEAEKKEETKIPVKRKVIVKKKVLSDKSNVPDEAKNEVKSTTTTTGNKMPEKQVAEPAAEETPVKNSSEVNTKNEETATPPTKPVERRRSKIFETAEKFQNLLTNNESKTTITEKPKKIFIPGVNVGGFKKEFERKASLTTTAPPPDVKKIASKKTVPSSATTIQNDESSSSAKAEENEPVEKETKAVSPPPKNKVDTKPDIPPEDKEQERRKTAVSIISNAINKEGTRKSKSRPCMMRKPPVPFGINGRSASGSIGMSPIQYTEQSSPTPEENKKSSCEITLKSATLPRRKTSSAQIKLDYPPPKPAQIEFKTEMAHRIDNNQRPTELKTQRSEILVPVNNQNTVNNNNNNRVRSSSVDPEMKPKDSPKERIIPISFERDDGSEKQPEVTSPQAKPPMPKPFQQTQRPTPQRFGSISRQSTHDSDSEATISENMEPIRKSPREYIIPIAVEGGGYVTPRATSLEPSETSSISSSTRRSMPKFGRPKRMGSLLSDYDASEEEPFPSLHRHNSVGRDSDNEDSRREQPFHMHRLRSSRPTRKANLEHADSLSSGEEDDDDGFEILTAENLFSTLLSRVRSLTQRLNVEDNGRLGFPNTRLLGNFDHGSKLFNFHNDPLSRFSPLERAFHRDREPSRDRESSVASSGRSSAPWRRSVSRDLATDIERVFKDTPAAATATLPRDKMKKKEVNNLDLSELKLSEEDALALSYLTPGLSRRIQNQLLSQMPRLKKSSTSDSKDGGVTIRPKSRTENLFSDSSDSEYNLNKYDRDTTDYSNNYRSLKRRKNNSLKSFDYTPIAENSILDEHNHNSSRSENTTNIEPKIYKLDDIKKQYNKNEIDNFTKYTPYRNCYRSTSLIEPSTSNAYKNPLYFRNVNFSSENFDTKYNHDLSTTPKYNNRTATSLLSSQENLTDPTTTRLSRFMRPNYYENCLFSKEREKREMETQKVLKEIRNKRNNNEHREKYGRDKSAKNDLENGNNTMLKNDESKSTDTSLSLSSECSTLDNSLSQSTNNTKTNAVEEKKVKRTGKISKLIRPKSYPTDSINNNEKPNDTTVKVNGCSSNTATSSTNCNLKSKLFKRSSSTEKSPGKDIQPTEMKKSTNSQFLSSIEKKIRSLYSENIASSNEKQTDKAEKSEKNKNEANSRIQSTIRSLREQSEPRTAEHCVTESGLIKRAVSVEDFSKFGKNPKSLQPSRKSVSKILGLFKKYEDKSATKANKTEDGETPKKSTNSVDGINKKTKSTKSDKSDTKMKNLISSDNNSAANNSEPKKTKLNKNTTGSKLPVSSSARLSSLERDTNSIIASIENKYNGIHNKDKIPKPDRSALNLNLNSGSYSRKLHNDNDDSSTLFSPCDESNDSWSISSDTNRAISPNSENHNKLFSEDENESVSDRIRRKSFYSRFNEKKKPRKTSLVGGSSNVYDYIDGKYTELPTNHHHHHHHSSKSNKTKDGNGNDSMLLNKTHTNPYLSYSTKKDSSRLVKRATSLNDNYYTSHNPSSKYRDSSSNLASDDKIVNSAIDKNTSSKSKRYLQAEASRYRERMSMSPGLTESHLGGTSSSHQEPLTDIQAPL